MCDDDIHYKSHYTEDLCVPFCAAAAFAVAQSGHVSRQVQTLNTLNLMHLVYM